MNFYTCIQCRRSGRPRRNFYPIYTWRTRT